MAADGTMVMDGTMSGVFAAEYVTKDAGFDPSIAGKPASMRRSRIEPSRRSSSWSRDDVGRWPLPSTLDVEIWLTLTTPALSDGLLWHYGRSTQ
jgi:hypothetical protein